MQTTSSASKPDGDQEKEVHIFVDGEREDVDVGSLTARQIIAGLAKRDPANYYLVQIHGDDRISYQANPDESIPLKNGMRFQTVLTGPTPVSDGTLTGPAAFARGLAEAGFKAASLPEHSDHLYFEYVVPSGTRAGSKVKIGVIVPQDFPETPPSGPHVSPHVFPINTGGMHPYGAIHLQQSANFTQATGEPWQYWSRPFKDWSTGRKTVAAYLSHIWRLWDSQ